MSIHARIAQRAANAIWVSFTPTWTNLTVGNGTQDFEYAYVPDGLRVRGVLTWGSTTSASGTVAFTLPNSEQTRATGGGSEDTARFTVGGTHYMGSANLGTSDTTINFPYHGGGVVNATSPGTWASGDTLRFDVTVAL